MSRSARFAFAFTVLIVLCVLAPQAAPPQADKDTPRATAAGTTFTLPAGWTMTTKGSMALLAPPETDSHVAIVDVKAKDADAAVAAAWAAYQPGFKRPLRISLPQAVRNGWEERKVYQYETSPNERAVVQALAARAGDSWTVVVVDGSEPTFEKRGAPLSLVLQSLRPKGYTRETFAGKKPHPLDEKRLAVLKDFVAGAMKMLDTPGVGLAFIDGGKTVWAGGLGVRELGKPDPVG
ncbi:MAG: serine hydrolase, partial [Acidobacteria bacterium]